MAKPTHRAAAVTGKHFGNIKAEPTELVFVPWVRGFPQNIVDDGKRVEALARTT
jgi:hypothetical protein